MNQDYMELAKRLLQINQCRHLKMKAIDAEEGKLTLELPYSSSLIGNPASGVIHGGAITTLMDSCCGFAVPLALEGFQICPTLDLRIDYLFAAKPKQSVFASSEVYRISPSVVFVRGTAWQKDAQEQQQTIAHCTATFMRLEKTGYPITDSNKKG